MKNRCLIVEKDEKPMILEGNIKARIRTKEKDQEKPWVGNQKIRW